jgi:hypothetical protein
MAGLSSRAMKVLRRVRSNLQSARGVEPVQKREEVWARVDRELLTLPVECMAEVHEARRLMEGKAHANWAAQRLVAVLRNNGMNAYRELYDADIWARHKLRCGYLVQAEWLEHAYQAALRLAKEKRG